MDQPSPGSSARPNDASRAAIEAMPRLVKKITLMWKSQELDGFIQNAILDGRDGDRQGFPMEVGAELLFLAETNRLVRAFDLAARKNLKFGEAYRMVEQGDRAALAPMGISPWLDPLNVGSSRISNIPSGGASSSLLKPKARKRGLLARIFSIR